MYQRCNTPFFLGSLGSKLIPDLAPPIAGPETENFTSIVLAKDKTSFISNPLRILVPPPAAPPRNELITVHPSASVSESFQLKMISGCLFSNFFNKSFIKNGCYFVKQIYFFRHTKKKFWHFSNYLIPIGIFAYEVVRNYKKQGATRSNYSF